MEDILKILSTYIFYDIILFNIVSTILIGYIATFICGDELVPILAAGFCIINISYMVMVSNIISRINKVKDSTAKIA